MSSLLKTVDSLLKTVDSLLKMTDLRVTDLAQLHEDPDQAAHVQVLTPDNRPVIDIIHFLLFFYCFSTFFLLFFYCFLLFSTVFYCFWLFLGMLFMTYILPGAGTRKRVSTPANTSSKWVLYNEN